MNALTGGCLTLTFIHRLLLVVSNFILKVIAEKKMESCEVLSGEPNDSSLSSIRILSYI